MKTEHFKSQFSTTKDAIAALDVIQQENNEILKGLGVSTHPVIDKSFDKWENIRKELNKG